MPPESLGVEAENASSTEAGYDGRKFDTWSLGTLFYYIWCRSNPYPRLTPVQIMFKVSEQRMVPAPPWPVANAAPPTPLANLLYGCWKREPSDRPEMEELAQELRRIRTLFVIDDESAGDDEASEVKAEWTAMVPSSPCPVKSASEVEMSEVAKNGVFLQRAASTDIV
jgi:hypothetical protein